MMYKVVVQIILEGDPKLLTIILGPENSTATDFKVETKMEEKALVNIIRGDMKISTLAATVDDIIKTAILATEVDKIQ